MIRMSWFGPRTLPGLPGGVRPRQHPAGWYALCIGLCGGCLYTEPVWTMNEPPILLEPEGDILEEFTYDLGTGSFPRVVVLDPDSEELLVTWIVPGDLSPVFTYVPSYPKFTSSLTLPYDPELDGALVQARLSDELSGTDLTVKFRIVAGGEF